MTAKSTASPRLAGRRVFLRRRTAGGLGCSRWRDLLRGRSQAASRDRGPLAPHKPHFPAKAKSRHLAVHERRASQVDTWDYKPELEKRDGQELKGFDKNTGFFTDQVGP